MSNYNIGKNRMIKEQSSESDPPVKECKIEKYDEIEIRENVRKNAIFNMRKIMHAGNNINRLK